MKTKNIKMTLTISAKLNKEGNYDYDYLCAIGKAKFHLTSTETPQGIIENKEEFVSYARAAYKDFLTFLTP
jgi:hypothetical protein